MVQYRRRRFFVKREQTGRVGLYGRDDDLCQGARNLLIARGNDQPGQRIRQLRLP